MASLAILVPAASVLVFTAIAVACEAGRKGVANPGPHGFTEILYAFSSASNNNGSAFGGLSANTPFYNTTLGLAMFFGRFWVKLPVAVGNLVQLAGLDVGALIIALAAAIRSSGWPAVILLVVGVLVVYLCCHAVAHWLVGRAVGLRFAYVGVRGTDHPEAYPPGLRQVMAATPMFTAVSTKKSRASASRGALAAYYAAGETSTTVCTLLAAGAGLVAGIPGSLVLFIIAVVWVLIATVTTAIFPRGDYFKAREALRSHPL